MRSNLMTIPFELPVGVSLTANAEKIDYDSNGISNFQENSKFHDIALEKEQN